MKQNETEEVGGLLSSKPLIAQELIQRFGKYGIPENLALQFMQSWVNESYHPFDVSPLIRSIYGSINPQKQYYECSERGVAQRIITLFDDQIKFCEKMDTWFIWNGAIWTEKGSTIKLTRIVEFVTDSIKHEAICVQKEGKDKEYEALNKLYLRYSQDNQVKSLLRYVARSLQIEVSQLDDPGNTSLLNVRNGILNLKTGKLLSHDSRYFMTKIAPVIYDPSARCPRWEQFLNEIFAGDMELIQYLQEVIGYCLTGDTGEEAFFYFYGPTGRNGKSKFINQIMTILGTEEDGYATSIPSDSLTGGSSGSSTYNIAKLKGKRFVSAPEADRNRKFSAPLIKQLTGGDVITARTLYQKPFDFKPIFKLIITGNFLLGVSGSDSAFFSRLKVIPFNVRIPDEKQDPNLDEKLKAEISGILNWAVQGSIRWWDKHQNGCSLKKMPTKVREETLKYQEEMDELRLVFNDLIDTDPGLKIETTVLYEEYRSFCQYNRIFPLGKRNFNQALRARGFDDKKSNGKTFWYGIGLKGGSKLRVAK